MAKIFISKPYCWAPGVTDEAAWQEWKNGKLSIQKTTEAPAIAFTSPLFRRRLSQICKMVIQAVHDIIEQTGCGDIKIAFLSTHGDIKRQFDVSRQTLVDMEILPASFSYSVFNAPAGLASLACKLKKGYSVIFPQNGDFSDSLITAAAPVLCGDEKSQILVYADELIPEEYEGHYKKTFDDGNDFNEPFVFASVISARKTDVCNIEVNLDECNFHSPQSFLKEIL